jgi:hypothetical protein
VDLGYDFDLYQKTDDTLIIRHHENKTISAIDVAWDKNKINTQAVSLHITQLEQDQRENLLVWNQGIIASKQALQHHWEKFNLPREMFDIASLEGDDKEDLTIECLQTAKVSLRCIWSYHKKLDGVVILGHDAAIISIWKLINNERLS